ncbi:Hypothetical predicted protein [Olea europaea subsp. europaea]|uniref:Uncharacterized protein n=1 Tax=Olea europaea subsp. europaea TaxID=158383 RepID=A0A8S0TMQ2_OLEEU|nr:Hypothetical predicted protein [Olea europaea subsp. europaea]
MSPKKEGIRPSQTKEHVVEETSLQNAPIIQEPLPILPMVRHQRSGSRSRLRLASRLTRKMAAVIANMRVISRQMPQCEATIPVEGSWANASRGQASIFDRLGPTRDREGRPPNLPAQIGRPPVFSYRPNLEIGRKDKIH